MHGILRTERIWQQRRCFIGYLNQTTTGLTRRELHRSFHRDWTIHQNHLFEFKIQFTWLRCRVVYEAPFHLSCRYATSVHPPICPPAIIPKRLFTAWSTFSFPRSIALDPFQWIPLLWFGCRSSSMPPYDYKEWIASIVYTHHAP
jgi:hypothetical protein